MGVFLAMWGWTRGQRGLAAASAVAAAVLGVYLRSVYRRYRLPGAGGAAGSGGGGGGTYSG